jgi:Tol biopolymer transport system component
MEVSSTADIAEVAPAGSIICCSTKSGETSMVDISTGTVQILPFSGSSIEISPDRKTLAYVDRREQLHVYHLDSGIDVRLGDPEESEKYGSPTFVSNDTIAYVKRNRSYRTAVCLTHIDRLDERPWVGELPEGVSTSSSTLKWIPGTGEELYSFVLGNVYSIYVLAPHGSTTLVSADPKSGASLRYPAVSPDGATIAYVHKSSISSIWTINIDGRNKRQLTYSDGSWPTWSPDGLHIAFLTHAAGERGLLKQDIYDPSGTDRSVGSFLFGIGIIRRDGTPVRSVCGVDGKPVLTPGDYIAWR